LGSALQNIVSSINISLDSKRTTATNDSRHIDYPALNGIVRERYTFELFELMLA